MKKISVLASGFIMFALVSCSVEQSDTASLVPIELRLAENNAFCKSGNVPDAETVMTGKEGPMTLTMSVRDSYRRTTKGNFVTTDNIDQIGVWAKRTNGQNYFYDLDFSLCPDGVFRSDNKCFWPFKEDLELFCYYPVSSRFYQMGVSLSPKDESPSIIYMMNGNVFTHEDLCVSHVIASKDNAEVALHHMLSAIQFTAGSTFRPEMAISSIAIQNIIYSGTCQLDAPESGWTLNHSFKSSAFIMFSPGEEWKKDESVKDGDIIGSIFFILPQTITSTDQSYIQIVTKGPDGMKPHSFPLDCTWEMGKVYTFSINCE